MSNEFKLVPVEPTPEMLRAGLVSNGIVPVYTAMLAAAPQPPALGEWAIDESAGRPILTYKGCSVIEAEDAEYIMRLVAADKCAPALGGEPEVVGYGFRNTMVGRSPAMMELRPDIPANDQYGGQLWHPLITQEDHHAHLAPLQAEIERLDLMVSQYHHDHDQWDIERTMLKARCDELESALKFYADREHYHFESGNWDTVSGEPLNILWCGDEPDFIENGTVARAALSAPAGSEKV